VAAAHTTTVPVCVVIVHAHRDDEAALTGGTMAGLAAAGHRMVLVVATDGAAGLTAPDRLGAGGLAATRSREVAAEARALGVARVVPLGYPDSGLDGRGTPSTPGGDRAGGLPFPFRPPDGPAERVAAVLADEHADVVVGYDPNGGYGHCDHRQVHQVVRMAAARPPATVLLEVTRPREPLAALMRLGPAAGRVVPALAGIDPRAWASSYTARPEITHRIDVRAHLAGKQAALRAHTSQTVADGGPRTVGLLAGPPSPILARLIGVEWFIEPGRRRRGRPLTDLLAGLPVRGGRP